MYKCTEYLCMRWSRSASGQIGLEGRVEPAEVESNAPSIGVGIRSEGDKGNTRTRYIAAIQCGNVPALLVSYNSVRDLTSPGTDWPTAIPRSSYSSELCKPSGLRAPSRAACAPEGRSSPSVQTRKDVRGGKQSAYRILIQCNVREQFFDSPERHPSRYAGTGRLPPPRHILTGRNLQQGRQGPTHRPFHHATAGKQPDPPEPRDRGPHPPSGGAPPLSPGHLEPREKESQRLREPKEK